MRTTRNLNSCSFVHDEKEGRKGGREGGMEGAHLVTAPLGMAEKTAT